MTEECDVDLGEREGGRLESSAALTYDNLMDCYTSLSVPSGKQIFVAFHVSHVTSLTNDCGVFVGIPYDCPGRDHLVVYLNNCRDG